MIIGINESKTLTKHMVVSFIQMKNGIVDGSLKNIGYAKRIIFRILPNVVMKMVNVYQVLLMIQGLPVMKL